MKVLYPELVYNPELDQHFLNAIEQVDEPSHKQLLIDQTRDLYIRQKKRDLNHQKFNYQWTCRCKMSCRTNETS
jgi:hypothetical protein